MRREGGLVTHRSTDGIIPLTKGGNSVRRSIFFSMQPKWSLQESV